MEMLTTIVITARVLVALAIIGLVLLQHGKGADMGSGFGGGVLDAVKTQAVEKAPEKSAPQKPAAEVPKAPADASKAKDVPQ